MTTLEKLTSAEVVGKYDLAEIQKILNDRLAENEKEKLRSDDRMEMHLLIRGSEIGCLNSWWDFYLEKKDTEHPYTETQLIKGFMHAYVMSDVVYTHRDLIDWMLLKMIGKQHLFMTKGEMETYHNLPQQVKVYRGACRDGYSWTLSKEKAQWFCDRNNKVSSQKSKVMEKVVDKSQILAFLNGRKEREVIIIPKRLMNKIKKR